MARSPGSAEPDAATTRSFEKSPERSSSESFMIRCIITGITIRASTSYFWMVSRQSSGLNLRRSTIVEPSSIAMFRWAQPQVWNSGATM